MPEQAISSSAEFLSLNARLNLFTIKTVKGKLKNGTILQCWDPIDECTGKNCPAYMKCPYQKTGVCKVQRDYMRGIHNLMLNHYGDRLTEGLIYRIGQHLFPLYHTLMRLNIEELGVVSIVTSDDKGMKRINPIYKEIRETIKQIEFIWKSLGFTDEASPKPKDMGDDLKGNPDYYGAIQKDADRRKRLVRRSKPTSEPM